MRTVCFSSLKGGVGKTSLAVNIAHALAIQGYSTLLVDTDPLAHATRFFEYSLGYHIVSAAPFVEYLFSCQNVYEGESGPDASSCLVKVRDGLTLLPGGEEYRHFSFGKGARVFNKGFPLFLQCLGPSFDYAIIDTSSEFSVVTRAGIAISDLVAVPVDSSSMSLYGLESLVSNSSHIKVPAWCIVRTMIDRASPTQVPYRFYNSLSHDSSTTRNLNGEGDESCISNSNNSPIYLLENATFRTELQNLLSYVGNTAFEHKETKDLAGAYNLISEELSRIVSMSEHQLAPNWPASCNGSR